MPVSDQEPLIFLEYARVTGSQMGGETRGERATKTLRAISYE